MSDPGPMPQVAEQAEQDLRSLEWRDWVLWSAALFVIMLLAVAIYSYTLGRPHEKSVWLDSELIAARCVFAFVMVFAAFAIHRQLVIVRLRRHVSADLHLVNVLQARAELFQKLAILDPLTGLYNRRFAVQHLPTEMARAERHGYTLTVMTFDLNGLKTVNDRYGHVAGDLMLREFGAALRRAIRSSDLAVRMGGDEFLVILPECHSGDLPRILGRLSQLAVDYCGKRIEFHYAAGWAEYANGETMGDLLERADRHLYKDKLNGGAEQKGLHARELVRQNEKLTAMGLVTSSVAHDFNNMLTVIKGFADLTLESDDIPPAVRKNVEEIQSAAERAASVTRQLLAFSRKRASEPQLVCLNQVVDGMTMMMNRLVGDKISLSLELDSQLHQVRVDASQLEQILMNLVANARDAMPQGGSLVVQTGNFEMNSEFCGAHDGARLGTYATLGVHDTGVGIDAETQSHIFEPFFTTKSPGQGTGLGLSTAYGIVKQHGGYIWLDSTPGKGTSVTIYLPRAVQKAPAAVVEQSQRATAETSSSKAPVVLVVETFDALRRLICDLLHKEGYSVLEADNSEAAIRLAAERTSEIKMVIADLIMPGMSGMELAETIRTHTPQSGILYVSGYADDAALYRNYFGQQTGFLGTPFTAQELSAKVSELLAHAAHEVRCTI